MEAELAALRALIAPGPRGSLVIGGPRSSNRIELLAGSSRLIVEHDKVTITTKRVTINGIAVQINGDSITLDAPAIAIKGAGETVLKGAKLREN